MKTQPQSIDVRRYDAVVTVLQRNPAMSFPEVAERSGVSEKTVRRIWDGTICRPAAIVLERLTAPRRCRECGARCIDWPCVICEMKRRNNSVGLAQPVQRFVYRSQKQ